MATLSKLKVRDVMSTNLIALGPNSTIKDAAQVMRDSDVGAVLVNTSRGTYGMVTDRDIVVRAIAEEKDPKNIKLEEICSRELTTVTPEDDLDQALQMMRVHAIRRILVMDHGKASGIISIGDLAQRLDRASLLGEISAAPPNH